MGTTEQKPKSVILSFKSIQKAKITMLDEDFPFNNIGLYFEVANEMIMDQFKIACTSDKELDKFHDEIIRIIKKLKKEDRINEHYYKGK